MDSKFDENESLLRAVYPASTHPNFWKGARISSAALKDKKGLSVTRTYDRTVGESVKLMTQYFKGAIVAITVQACNDVQAYIKYAPSNQNKYHSEIHGSETQVVLSSEQAFKLAKQATLEFQPEMPNANIQLS